MTPLIPVIYVAALGGIQGVAAELVSSNSKANDYYILVTVGWNMIFLILSLWQLKDLNNKISMCK